MLELLLLPLSLSLPPAAPVLQEDASAEQAEEKARKPKREGLPEKVEGTLPLEWADEAGTTLPIGVMLGGAFGADELLFSLAAELEAARPWYHRYDDLWTSLT